MNLVNSTKVNQSYVQSLLAKMEEKEAASKTQITEYQAKLSNSERHLNYWISNIKLKDRQISDLQFDVSRFYLNLSIHDISRNCSLSRITLRMCSSMNSVVKE